MNDTQLYTQLLGLTDAWQVTSVDLDPKEQVVRVHVEPAPHAVWTCPCCGERAPGYDLRESRSWRHLDSCEFQTWLVARTPRVQCPEHGIHTVGVPWAEPHSRFTLLFAAFARRVLQATRVQARTAALLRLTPAEVHSLLTRSVARGLALRDHARASGAESPAPQRLSLDEKQYGRGQTYLTVLGDHATGRVWDVGASRDLADVEALLTASLTQSERQQVRSVTLDLWQGFTGACRKVLPQAAQIYDRFHVSQELNKAVDKTRREEHPQLRQPRQRGSKRQYGDSPLTGTRWWWLHNAEDLPASQREQLEQWQQEGLQTAQVWASKEAFRGFFSQPDRAAGNRFLEQWAQEAEAVGSRALNSVVKQFRKHAEKLLAYLDEPGTNALGEYLNGAIQEIKSAARGFRRFAGYRRAILFFLGGLETDPQTFP
jgi:transposase